MAHDRRGHGRSSQVWDGHDMDHYADDVAAVVERLGVRGAIHVGHSTGGGEVVHYIARYPDDPVPKAAIISAVPPLMVKTEGNPGGLPKSVFDDLQAQLAANRAQFYQDIPAGPFYGYNRPGAQPLEGIVRNWWRQGMMGGAKAHYDGIVAFSQTDFSDDLKRIDIPVLVMHGDDDQIVPYENSGVLSAKLLRNGTLKTYPGFPHGMPTTQAGGDQRRPAGLHPRLSGAGCWGRGSRHPVRAGGAAKKALTLKSTSILSSGHCPHEVAHEPVRHADASQRSRPFPIASPRPPWRRTWRCRAGPLRTPDAPLPGLGRRPAPGC
ncbi:chloroperoxidase [Pseudomonas aeruginosa]|nr:chloroperoxidase [Pseudomonas aeruginosa]